MTFKQLSTTLLSSSLLLFAHAAFGACTDPLPANPVFPQAPAVFSHTAIVDGSWNATTTWNTGTVPGNFAIVCIPAGRRVTVTSQETSTLRFIAVDGELRMWIHSSTRLYVDTVYVASTGTFVIGDSVNTVKPGVVAELVFTSWNSGAINTTWDPKEKSRGFFSDGIVRMYGEAKTHMAAMTADALKNAVSLTVDTAPTNWKIGDRLVLTGSYFREVGTPTSSQDEEITIASISGNVIGFSPALVYDHVRPRSDLRLHVANLTRNVVLRSGSTATGMRGHVMLQYRDIDIRHTSLVDLGRTNKEQRLDDFIVTKTADGLNYTIAANTGSITNRRGRYALHVHQNGTLPGSAPPSKVYNSVVDGTIGWGFVNHSSHVDFQNNVAYDFVGAGFVTEAGDELGNFDNNIAIRGIGNGEYRTNRIVFANDYRRQPLADFAFSGDGFWFQGPAVRVRNNVASGCDGAGMIWFTTGQPDVEQIFTDTGGFAHDRYTHFPKSAVSTVYSGFSPLPSPRYWDHSATNEKLVISDLPILEMDGFESYGNLVGFRLRFNNADNGAWYGENPYNFNTHIVGTGTRVRQKIKNLKLWNNELGFRPNYTSKGDWTNVLAMNRLDYNAQSPYIGAEIDFNITDTTFSNLTIDGYEVAGKIENCSNNARTNITFLVSKNYDNFANADTWHQANPCNGAPPPTCATPTGVTVSSTNPRMVSWTANPAYKHILVRYRLTGAQQWNMIDTATTGSPLNLGTLPTGYTYQVMAGCKDGTGKETAPSNYTAAATF